MEQAWIELAGLEMKGDDIDEYIAKFKNLLRKGEIPCEDVAALFRFKGGLRKGVHAGIFKRDKWPTTLDKWQECARREVRHFDIMKESLGERGNYQLSIKQSKWCAVMQQFRPMNKSKKDEAIPMEIDSAQMQPHNSEKEAKNTKLKQEERCFKCEKQGHIKRNCPEWDKKGEKPPSYQLKGCTTSATTLSTPTPNINKEEEEPNLKELAHCMHFLNDSGKEQLFDLIMEKDF